MERTALGALAITASAAFLAATVLPFQSEVAVVAAETAPVWLMLLVASVANTLASVVNRWMARYVEH